MKMKMKKKKMKIFLTCLKYFDLYFSKALNCADFKYVFRSKVTALQRRQKMVKNGQKQAKWTHFGGM